MERRNFLQWLSAAGGTLWYSENLAKWLDRWGIIDTKPTPLVLSTWSFTDANKEAWSILESGGNPLNAVEAGVRIEEANPDNHTVGYGGRPDREGTVSLDAAVMNDEGDAGAVSFLRNIRHPISVARRVMEDTPHVMLSGSGAKQFAMDAGFELVELLTEEAREQYKQWLRESEYQPRINIEQHDTIGMIALDGDRRLAAACSTSGLAYKMPGRVADSCLVGAGIYLDPRAGAAVATGYGEHIIKTAGTYLVVEEIRRGTDPESACRKSIERMYERTERDDYQAALVACDLRGRVGAYSLKKGFSYTLSRKGKTKVFRSGALLP